MHIAYASSFTDIVWVIMRKFSWAETLIQWTGILIDAQSRSVGQTKSLISGLKFSKSDDNLILRMYIQRTILTSEPNSKHIKKIKSNLNSNLASLQHTVSQSRSGAQLYFQSPSLVKGNAYASLSISDTN